MVIAALVEALAGRAYVGGDAVNTLLAALTLLVVGGPGGGSTGGGSSRRSTALRPRS